MERIRSRDILWYGIVLPCAFTTGGMREKIFSPEFCFAACFMWRHGFEVNILTHQLFSFFSLQSSSDSHDEAISAPIAFEISSNASKFAAFSAIRSLVLEHETKYNTLSKIENRTKSFDHQSRSRSEDEGNESKIVEVVPKSDNKINVPHVSY